MKSQWQVQRTLVEHDDAARRWDYAFQYLLRYMEAAGEGQPGEEHQNENRPVRPRIKQSTTATAND